MTVAAFGVSPFGSVPFGDAARPRPRLVMVASIDVTIDFRVQILVGTVEFITGTDDDPASKAFKGSLMQPLSMRRSIVQTDGFGGFIVGQGEIVIQNTDASFDALPQRYALDGRPAEVRHGRLIDDFRDWPVVFRGNSADCHLDEAELRVPLQDSSYLLDVPLQTSLYGGTGGIDGGDDLTGKRKPRLFGYCRNVAPPLVLPTSLLYQVNDGPVQAIPAVYSRGAALTVGSDHATSAQLIAASVISGRFDTCLAEGMFRVNFTLEGEVTADVEGDASGSGFVSTRADIVRRIIGLATTIGDPDGLYLPAFALYATAQPGDCGCYFGHDDQGTVSDAIADAIGTAAWAGFRRSGQFEVMQFDAPAGVPAMRADETKIRGEVQRDRLPSGLSPAPWRWKVPYARNWTVITDPASSISEAQRSFLAEEDRFAVAEAAGVKNDHPLAQERIATGASYRNVTDAQTEADRLLTLFRRTASLYRMRFDLEPFVLNIGQTMRVTYPRFDLVNGRLLRVVEIGEDAAAEEIEVVAYG